MRIVFAGTPEFAATHLEALLEAGYDVVAVYTQPDRRAGRGRRPRPSPVKALAVAHQRPVRQPLALRDAAVVDALRGLAPDLIVVVAYGLILPRAVLELPVRGCVNVHASLLPRWRGAAPIQRALLAGDAETGVSIMQMDEGLDTGPVLARAATPITAGDTAASLHERLARLGSRVLLETLGRIEQGLTHAQPQAAQGVTYAPKLTKEEAEIDWRVSATEIERRVRAFDPWPVAHTVLDGQALRVWAAEALDRPAARPPGHVLAAGHMGIDVACGEGVLRITRLQRPGGRPIAAADFLNAHPLAVAGDGG